MNKSLDPFEQAVDAARRVYRAALTNEDLAAAYKQLVEAEIALADAKKVVLLDKANRRIRNGQPE